MIFPIPRWVCLTRSPCIHSDLVGRVVIDEAFYWLGTFFANDSRRLLEGELDNSKDNQAVFTYFHLAGCRKATERILDAGITAIAYETVTDKTGGLPLLEPMS